MLDGGSIPTNPKPPCFASVAFSFPKPRFLPPPVWYCGPMPAQTVTMNIQTRTSKVKAIRGDAGGQREATVALRLRKNTSPTFPPQPQADGKGLDSVGAARTTDNLR